MFTSGLALGKLVSFAIGTKPPTSSTRSIIRMSIAEVVATCVSFADQVSPDLISSELSCLKNKASECFAEYTLVSLVDVPEVTTASPVILSKSTVPLTVKLSSTVTVPPAESIVKLPLVVSISLPFSWILSTVALPLTSKVLLIVVVELALNVVNAHVLAELAPIVVPSIAPASISTVSK